MSTVIPDLWPEIISVAEGNTPVTILRRQAVNLGKRTRNLVYGEVRSRPFDGGKKIELAFDVVAPLVGYQETILRVSHDVVAFYPVQIVESELTKRTPNFRHVTAETEAEFTNKLREFLNHPAVLELVQALLAQSTTTDSDPE